MNYTYILTVFIMAFFVAFLLTPLVKKLAIKLNAIDVPNDKRRIHDHPIPRLGGLAIVAGFTISTLLYGFLVNKTSDNIFDLQLLGLFLGIIVIEVVGVLDDIYQLKAWQKLIFQILAAVIVVNCGTKIEFFTNPLNDEYIFFGVWSAPITILWIVGITNAINFIDGLDGLAAGVASISALSLLFISIFLGNAEIVVLAASLAGATLGFLPFNFNPAKIFMGDTGSTFLGFTLGTIAIMGMIKSYTVISVVAPLIVFGLPIFDTAFAILRRIAKGQSPMVADRGHLHHRLVDAGLSQRQTVLILYLISTCLGIMGFLLTQGGIIRVVLLFVALMIFIIAGQKIVSDMNKSEKN
ncbi:MAG: undecaprenyl/decaprenyl-phosphate alpha-N-acetylglucosaminyl 1-phosphate transferase [Clostridia bacterium]|nr:undecaprenyl/decaprenyl-phosphate alpha-N-acetylglucosaminyl 1-phosphate transferase [Clostridia bacterium]